MTIGQLLSSKFGIQKLTQGKFLNYFVGIIFGNFSGVQNFISMKKNFFFLEMNFWIPEKFPKIIPTK